MRESKYRAINNDGEWCYGLPCYDKNGIINTMTLNNGFHDYFDKAETLGEFTGIKDEAGREIYQDDIYLIDGYGLGKVIIDSYQGVCFEGLKDYGVVSLSHVIQLNLDYDYKGNVHVNHELLEKQQ